MENNISFTSLIKPVGNATFRAVTSRIPKVGFVPQPWTLKEAAMASDVFTTSVMDCSVYIISDGAKAKMYHIFPESDDAKFFQRIEKDIKSNFDMNSSDVEAFVVGGKPPFLVGDKSYELFDKFTKFSEKHNIPTTILKGGRGERSIAYSSTTDTLYITNTQGFSCDFKQETTPLNILKNWFDKIIIHSKDSVSL